jgi:hypothetical protein
MSDIILDFLNNILSGAFGSFDTLLGQMLGDVLYIEKLFSSALSTDSITKVYNYIYVFCCVLCSLKFCTKGFKIYILWRDGDADSSIQDMLTGVAQAVVVMVGFPYCYDLLASVTLTIGTGIMGNFGFSNVSMSDLASILLNPQKGIFLGIILLIYVIMVIVLFVMLIKRGVELLVLRLGMPFACTGLLDSDFGAFKSFVQTLIKTMFTSIIQITLFSLSIRLMTTISIMNLLCGIAAISTAYSTPTIMQGLLVPTGSTNIINKISSGARIASAAKSFIGG